MGVEQTGPEWAQKLEPRERKENGPTGRHDSDVRPRVRAGRESGHVRGGGA